jgi:hypothetical protein
MARFSILVAGENIEGESRVVHGFLVWRSVDAGSEAAAEQQALESIRNDPKMAGVPWSAVDGPRLQVRAFHRVENWSSPPPGSGFTFI